MGVAVLRVLLVGFVSMAVAGLLNDEECKSHRTIDDNDYRSSTVVPSVSYGNLVIEEDGTIFFINVHIPYIWTAHGGIAKLVGPNFVYCEDIIRDKNGNILIFTRWDGIFKYVGDNSVTRVSKSNIQFRWVVTSPNDVIYASSYNDKVYKFHNNTWQHVKEFDDIQSIEGIEFDGNSNLYYGQGWSNNFFKRNAGSNVSIEIKGFESASITRQIKYDQHTNLVYVCRDSGLFTIKPSSTVAVKVAGYNSIYSIGLGLKGVIYVGTYSHIHKVEPISWNPCDFENSALNLLKNIEKNDKSNESSKIVSLQKNIKNVQEKLDTVTRDLKEMIEEYQTKSKSNFHTLNLKVDFLANHILNSKYFKNGPT